AKVGEASGGDRVPSPIECLQLILKPVAMGHQELLDFLRALVTKIILNPNAVCPTGQTE
ncbi:hypothetical protein M9458_011164, partial [Cirrhinus mrigala]